MLSYIYISIYINIYNVCAYRGELVAVAEDLHHTLAQDADLQVTRIIGQFQRVCNSMANYQEILILVYV